MKNRHNIIPDAAIRALDLKPVIAQLLASDGHFKEWSILEMKELAKLYRMFLFLCKKYSKQNIVPTREIDLFWHQHVLNTRKYQSDCDKIFGSYLHHEPELPVNIAEKPNSNLSTDFQRTLELVQKEFYS